MSEYKRGLMVGSLVALAFSLAIAGWTYREPWMIWTAVVLDSVAWLGAWK
jgi:hypothetical protein